LTVPMRAPANPCAAVTLAKARHAAAHESTRVRRDRVFDRLTPGDDVFTGSLLRDTG